MPMDPVTVSVAVTAIATYLANSKGGQQAQDELTSGIWNWIKPLFIKEDEEFVKELEAKPDNSDLIKELELKLKRKAAKDEELAGKLQDFVNSINQHSSGSQVNITQSNIHGDNIGGDKNIYNK